MCNLILLFIISTVALKAETAIVQVWVKDGATGKAIKDALLVVLQNADTVAVAKTMSVEASQFQLAIPSTSVEDGKHKTEMPSSFRTIEAYPNPCGNKITLNIPPGVINGTSQVRVYNVLGQQLFSGPVFARPGASLNLELLLQNVGKGIYFIRATDSHGQSAFGKFLKIEGTSTLASGSVQASEVHSSTRGSSAIPKAMTGSTLGTYYTFTAFSNKSSQDADGSHVGGYASITVPISRDTTIELALEKVPYSESGYNLAPQASTPITIDGIGEEAAWSQAKWGAIDQLWLYAQPGPADFTGRYKIVWTPERLYVLAEIRDDSLSDQFSDPYSSYYKDDCFEVFLDEDGSGGNHQYNYSAFAYHISIFGAAMDSGPDMRTHDFSDHIEMQMSQNGDVYTWEIGIKVFAATYNDKSTTNVPVTLAAGKVMGLMFAYCDNDGTFDRQSFIGSIFISGQDKNVGWINASVFGTLELLP
jgi:hypothetical protein